MKRTLLEWIKLHEQLPVTQQATAGNPQQATAGDPQQAEMQNFLTNMIRKRLDQLFTELEKYKMSKKKAMELFGVIFQELQKQYGLTSANARTAIQGQNVAQQPEINWASPQQRRMNAKFGN